MRNIALILACTVLMSCDDTSSLIDPVNNSSSANHQMTAVDSQAANTNTSVNNHKASVNKAQLLLNQAHKSHLDCLRALDELHKIGWVTRLERADKSWSDGVQACNPGMMKASEGKVVTIDAQDPVK